MELESPTNPVEGEDTADATLPETQEVETDDQNVEYDDGGNPIEAAPEEEEVDLDDELKLKLPKEQAKKLKEGYLRQADYTRKTQEVAEQRKAFEAEREAVVNASNEELEAFATMRSLQGQLNDYANVDWQAEMARANANYDDEAARNVQAAYMRYQTLRDQFQAAQGKFSQVRNQRLSAAQHENAKRLEEGRATLQREVGWNDELKAKAITLASEFGFSRDEMGDLEADPRAAKILVELLQSRDAKAKQQKAQHHIDAQQVKPAAKVGGNSPPPQGLDDRLSPDEWLRRRNAQLAKRGR